MQRERLRPGKMAASSWKSQDPRVPPDDNVDDRLLFATTFLRINNVIFWLFSRYSFLNVVRHTVASGVGPNEHYTLYSIQQTPMHLASYCDFRLVLRPPSCRTSCDNGIFRNPYDCEVMWLCVAVRNLFKYGILIHCPITSHTEWRSIPFMFYIQNNWKNTLMSQRFNVSIPEMWTQLAPELYLSIAPNAACCQ